MLERLSLDEAITRAGHRSIVVASEDSEALGNLISVPRVHGVLDEETRYAQLARRELHHDQQECSRSSVRFR